MTLTAGTRVGVYEVIELVGAGGMGEVYRALDTRLKRDVALKVLPASLAGESDRLLRFAREAEMLAALNHPNIAAIYGVEDAESSNPAEAGHHVRALVMELVEGETLTEQIARGPIPLTEALSIARQIALALESAHEQGIVHRDLKPANVKLRDDGTVKVLDFGLAKLADPIGAAAGSSPMSLSPTITSPALMTNAGMLLGTAAYMSPEQAKGRPADKRSDMWAFGCVLFEMLTAKRAFEGEDVSETLAGVLRGEPEWAALPAETPPAIRALIRRCLERDRRKRVADSAAALFVLDEHASLIAEAPPPDEAAFRNELSTAVEHTRRTTERRGRRWLLAGISAAALVGAAATAGTWWAMRPAPRIVSRLALPPSRVATPQISQIGADIAITSDGSRIVYYTGGAGGSSSFAVRSLDADAATPLLIPQSGGAFLSPDGAWIGYYDTRDSAIKKVPITGGPAVPIASGVVGMRGASWTVNDTIIFGTSTPDGLWEVPAAGGKATPLTVVDKSDRASNHVWPHVLPGGRAVLFTLMSTGANSARIAVVDLQTKQYREVIPAGTFPKYSPTGHIVYAAGGALFAVAFDLETLSVTTTVPEPFIDGVVMKESGAANFDLSANGTLVYIGGGGDTSQRSVAWVDKQGGQQPVPNISPREYRSVSVGPGGRQIAFESGSQGDGNLWIYDVASGRRNVLTSGAGDDRSPTWTADGRRIVFSSNRDGQLGIYAINADGTGSVDQLAPVPKVFELWSNSWSTDEKTLIVSAAGANTSADILAVAVAEKKVTPLLATPVVETQPAISPDGQWLAYMAVRERRPEVYVERYPTFTDRRTLSNQAGVLPLWSNDGKEVYYIEPSTQQMMSVSLTGSVFGTPKPMFKVPLFFQQLAWRTYDVMPDGRFIMILRGIDREIAAPTPMVVQNFSEELKKRVPTK